MDENEQQEQPKEHPPTDCMCPVCKPAVFAGKIAEESLPKHLCQYCFVGLCYTPVDEPVKTDERA